MTGPAPAPARPPRAAPPAADRTPPRRPPPGRRLVAVTVLRGAYGAALCCAPAALIRLAGGPAASRQARIVARVLGGRHIAQAIVCAARPAPAVLAAGAGVDLLHSASMIALAVLDRPCRRMCLTDSLIAATFAASNGTGPAA